MNEASQDLLRCTATEHSDRSTIVQLLMTKIRRLHQEAAVVARLQPQDSQSVVVAGRAYRGYLRKARCHLNRVHRMIEHLFIKILKFCCFLACGRETECGVEMRGSSYLRLRLPLPLASASDHREST